MYLLFSITVFLNSYSYGQSVFREIEGMVVDTAGVALKGVNVRLTTSIDTITMATSNKGVYRFRNIKGENLGITFSLLGYQINYKSIPVLESMSYVFIPNVVLTPQHSLIKEVNVIKTIPVIYKQDTVQYNMSAFNFRKNALLEESLKQLPGIHVARDGSVYSSGKLITTVRVDGKKFFGGDVLTATRNLPTDFISKIQIIDSYDDESRAKGIHNTEPEKVINILLKEDKKRIVFGQVTGGAGTSDRYIGSAGINRFNDGQELSAVASFNNTNTSLFSFGSPNGLGGRAQSLSDIGDFSDPVDGLNKISSFGLNFSDAASENVNINGGYHFTHRENFIEGFSKLTSSYVGNRINNEETFVTNTNDYLHRLFFEVETRFKNKDILKVSPTFTYNKAYSGSLKNRLLENYRVLNRGEYQDTTVLTSPNAEVNVLYSRHFEKPKRQLVVNAHVVTNNSSRGEHVSDYYHVVDSTKTNPTYSEFDQQQFIENRNEMNSARLTASYVEPFNTHSLLELRYEFDITDINAVRRVEDKLLSDALGELVYVDSLGVDYNYLFRSNRTGINYQYEPNNQFRTNIGFAVQPLTMTGKLPTDMTDYTYESVNLIPSAGIRYRFNNEFDWQIQYQGKNVQPNFTHILPVTDNSNSRYIIVGNPNLKAEFTNKISTTIRKSISSRSQYFETNFAYNFTNNKIVSSKRAIDNSTIQETTFENTQGYYDLRWYYVFNTPLGNDNIHLDLTGNADYYNNMSFINDQKNETKQLLYSQTLQLRYNWSDYFESVFNSNYFLNKATYQLPYSNKISSNTFLLSLGSRGYVSDRTTIGVEMSQKFHDFVNKDFMNFNPTIINAYLEFTFMKNNLALLRIQGFDLLDQNKNMGIYSEYIGNEIYESKSNRLGRYFMLTLNVRLQKYPKN